MDKAILKNVLLDQHNVIQEVTIHPREYELENDVCYVLVGLRRTGKSTLLYSKVRDYIRQGVSWEQIIYINFEDERLAEFRMNDFQTILLLKNEITTKKAYFFFDEIQNIDGWEKFARRLADSNETVCITGSNSKMLSSEIASQLGGRYLIKHILPYNFREFLRASSIEVDESTKSIGRQNAKFGEFLNFGGLPATLNFKNKREYLSSVYEKALLNDVLIHSKIRNEQFMKILVKKIAETTKDEVSFTKLNNVMKSIGFTSSKETIISYLSFLLDADLIFRVRNFYASFSEKESSPKYYFTDNGILNLFLNQKEGKLLENLVACALRRSGKEFYYLKSAKTGIDIDFYLPEENVAIQVSFDVEDSDVYRREVGNLEKLCKLQKDTRLLLITPSESKTIPLPNGKSIEVIAATKWLLGL